MTTSKKKNIAIYGLSLLLLLTEFLPGVYVKTAVFAVALYGAWLTNLANPSLLLLIASVLTGFCTSNSLLILMTLPAYLGHPMLNVRMRKSGLWYVLATGIALGLSLLLGQKTNARTMLLFVLCFCAYYSVANGNLTALELKAYGLSGMVILLVLLARDNGGTLLYGRLSINGSIRTLANATAVVLLLLLTGIINDENRGRINIPHYAAVAMGVLILFATVSRGAIIAFCASALVLFLTIKMPTYKKVICMVALAVVVLLVLRYLSASDALSTDRLMENEEGFNGRTDIWLFYWKQMTKTARGLLFGFGPGDLKRLTIIDYYAHSLFLDILFSYGVVGFLLIMGGMIGVWAQILRSQNAPAISLLAFAVLLFATHGVSTVSSYYILLGLAKCISKKRKNRLTGNAEVLVR